MTFPQLLMLVRPLACDWGCNGIRKNGSSRFISHIRYVYIYRVFEQYSWAISFIRHCSPLAPSEMKTVLESKEPGPRLDIISSF